MSNVVMLSHRRDADGKCWLYYGAKPMWPCKEHQWYEDGKRSSHMIGLMLVYVAALCAVGVTILLWRVA